ncbi:MAG: hypothetical protein IT342_05510, partial [Candidatus Melainabacteria bacterium]|nr:hypothetical protein [Candidatus Melainabacteria bacterium]
GGSRTNPGVQLASFVNDASQNVQAIGDGLRQAGMPEQQVQEFLTQNSPQQMMAALDPQSSGFFSQGGDDDDEAPKRRQLNPDDTDTA